MELLRKIAFKTITGKEPLWLLTRGNRILNTDTDISIDYSDLIWNLSYLIVPCVGLFIQPLNSTYKKYAARIFTPVSCIYIILHTSLTNITEDNIFNVPLEVVLAMSIKIEPH